jgi:hypothetical protein
MERIHSIADDYQRRALLWQACRKAMDLADEDFYHAMTTTGLDDESLRTFARAAFGAYTATIVFDYPGYADSLFLKAYTLAYRDHLRALMNGARCSMAATLAEVEAGIGFTTNGTDDHGEGFSRTIGN